MDAQRPHRGTAVVDEAEGRPFTALGSLVRRLVHPLTVGSDQLGLSVCLMDPGDRVQRHRHPYEEAYYVVSGRGRMYLEGEDSEIELRPGRAIYIAGGRIHGQVAEGDERLVLVCALSPPPVEGDPPDLTGGEPADGP